MFNQLKKEESEACEVLAHQIKMGDVDDPDLMIAAPIYEWQQTGAGKYIMKNSNPTAKWVRANSPITDYGYTYNILAYLTPQQVTYWNLKYK